MVIGEGTLSRRDNYHADSEGNRVPVVVMITCEECVRVFVFTWHTPASILKVTRMLNLEAAGFRRREEVLPASRPPGRFSWYRRIVPRMESEITDLIDMYGMLVLLLGRNKSI